jgi:hypothetical protein
MLILGAAAQDALTAQAPENAAGSERSLHAVRVDTPPTLDGRLDDDLYTTHPPTSGFIQQEPDEGQPATEQTDVWVFFDDETIYVSARCFDSHPERIAGLDRQRDGRNVSRSDHIVVVLDTFLDRRNGYYFQTNPSGAIRDQAIVDEKSNAEWNTVWNAKAGRFENGWTAEMAIPFKSLRYAQAGPQEWGINFRRMVKWKNEASYLTAVPAAYSVQGILKMSVNASLTGLETPARSQNIEIKPYAVSSLMTDRISAMPFDNKGMADGGIDFKYGLTRGLTADVTINTDFAQIEEDVQQVNLTRFSLFFPEKRSFFLEGQGIFLFGSPPVTAGTLTPGDVPVMFFSRRIGLSEGQTVPVRVGSRVTGKIGRLSLGALSIQTGAKPEAGASSTNFTVVRAKIDVLRRSSIGALVTNRRPSSPGTRSNQVFGADANFLFFQNLSVNGYATGSRTTGQASHASYRGVIDYASDRYGFVAEHLFVGDGFDSEVGYVQRQDMARTSLKARFSPRVPGSPRIRRLLWQGGMDVITDSGHETLQNRQPKGQFEIQLQNSDVFKVEYQHDFELLPQDFRIAPGVTVPSGNYDYDTMRVSYEMGQQRPISGTLSTGVGSFYGGTRREASYQGRIAPVPFIAFDPGVSLNWVRLPVGRFNVIQITSRVSVTPTPWILISSLIQFNAATHSLSSSVRLHWEYQSGSDLYVVYSDGRDTATTGFPDMLNRSFAVKVTRLIRF